MKDMNQTRKDLFPANQVNYILRTYLPTWNYEERIEEIIKFCHETDTRHVMLFTDAQHIVWNQLTLDKAVHEAQTMKKAQIRLAREGVRVGINSSYNQPMCRQDHRRELDYDYWATFQDGSCNFNLPCLLDPKLDIYLERFYTILAQVGADYIYVDDDHRYILQANNGTWGCFCDLHLGKFSQTTNTQWSREALSEALCNEPEIRRQWIEFLGERLVQIGCVIEHAIHSVNPDIKVGMMVPCVHALTTMGHNLKNVLSAFHPGQGKPLVRPCIGGYNDWNRRLIAPGLFYIEYIGHVLGDDIEYTTEIETGSKTRYAHSAKFMKYKIAQAILNRVNTQAITASTYVGDSPFIEPAYPEMLKNSRAFFEQIREHAPSRRTRKGVQLMWDFDSAKTSRRKIKSVDDLFWPAFPCHAILYNMGFPLTFDESPVKLLAGDIFSALPEERIKDILSQNVMIDAFAIKNLCDMGLGDLIGCDQCAEPPGDCNAEFCSSKEFFGRYHGNYVPLAAGWGLKDDSIFKLELRDGASQLSQITNCNMEVVAPGIAIYENSLGGKIALLPYGISPLNDNPTYLINYQHRQLFENIFNWMQPSLFPVFIESPTDFALQIWQGSRSSLVCITNLSLDETDTVTITVNSNRILMENARYIDSNGEMQPLSIEKTDRDGLWKINYHFGTIDPLIVVSDLV